MSNSHPQLGATFYPGADDDYYMPLAPPPDLISPSPQRIDPSIPENIQNNLASLELDSTPKNPHPAPIAQQREQKELYPAEAAQPPQQPLAPPPQQSNRASVYQSYQSAGQPSHGSVGQLAVTADMPNFSHFPPITPKPNVPPTDEEKEQILDNARHPVINSNDPEMQLAWAQDVLAYVATSQLYEERISQTQARRPQTPDIERQLRVDAMNIVGFLAEQQHPKALFMKGMWLEFGNFGQRQDKREAFRCYAKAAEFGYARAQYRMGMQFEQGQDPVKALIHYQRGAEAGDSASNYRLGMMTVMGQMGQQQDYARGLQMLRVAAENADENAPQGAYVLGMLMIRELPQVNIPEVLLPYDEAGARLNIEKAAYLGFAKAQLKMGAAFELCSMGCEFDPALSLHYNSLAARQGETEAEMAISKWFLCGYEGVFSKNDELAYVYAERAAQAGLATAEFAMGYFNEIGMHVKVSLEKAKEWYAKAAAQGNQDAIGRIEGLKKDSALSKDHEKAAINRIRSQYGSKRGGRPDRLKEQQSAPALPPLPSVSDYDNPNQPPRAASAAPYPLTDGPLNQRQGPGGAAPYPMDNGPPGRPGPAGGFFNPNSQGGPPPNGRQPSPSLQAFHFNTGPGGNQQPPRQGTPQGQGQQRFPSGPSGPGGFDQGRPGPGRQNSRSPRPGQDIGFVAPLQPRRTPSHSPGQSPVYGGTPPGQGGPGQRPVRQNTNPQQQGGRGGPPANNMGPGRPGPGPGRGQPAGPQQGRPGGAQQGRPGAQQKPAPKKSAPAAGTGPKTFEEMGIAAQQKDGECIVM